MRYSTLKTGILPQIHFSRKASKPLNNNVLQSLLEAFERPFECLFEAGRSGVLKGLIKPFHGPVRAL